MITERITINERQFAILHINETTSKVHRVDVHTPSSIHNLTTSHHATGISKEEALQEARRIAQKQA